MTVRGGRLNKTKRRELAVGHPKAKWILAILRIAPLDRIHIMVVINL